MDSGSTSHPSPIAVLAHQSGPVDGEPYRESLDGHIVDYLIVTALKEGGVDGRKWPHAVGREFLGRCLDVLAAEDLERLLQRLDLLLAHPHLMAEQNWRARLRVRSHGILCSL